MEHLAMTRPYLGVFVLCVLFASSAQAQGVFPGADWETAAPASQGLSAEKLDKAREWLATHNSRSGLVVRHGRIVAEWYFEGADRSSKFAAYSTSKSLSSIATGLAIADGKLTLDQTVGRYLPDVQPSGKKAITVKQLISMTSGVHNNPNITQREDLFRYSMNEAPLDHEPGSKWDYNNTGLSLLSPLFEKATGKQIDDFLKERVFTPIGIAADDWKWERRDGYAIPYSGCHITARGMGRIGLLALHKGEWNGQRVIPADWLKESIAPSQEMNPSYGYLWWNNTAKKWPNVPKDAFAALGRWDNNILIVPSLDLVVIRQSDVAPGQGHQIAEFFAMVCDAVAKP
jgi:CubicO group peptidase (beta-lactamase class C family)